MSTSISTSMYMSAKPNISTAAICAFNRAHHINAGGQVFKDYLAYELIGQDEYSIIHDYIENEPLFSTASVKDVMSDYLDPILLSRASYAERQLHKFAATNHAVQYVICGAGYDTFSFRNRNTNIRVFEVDQPSMQNQKLERIAKASWQRPDSVQFVPVDFEHDDLTQNLINSGFDPSVNAFFSILGVSYYLPLPIFAQTIANISEISTPGSQVVFDYPDPTLHNDSFGRGAKLAEFAARVGERMRGGYTLTALREVLAANKMDIKEYLPPTRIEKQYLNTSTTANYKAFDNIHFILAQKAAAA